MPSLKNLLKDDDWKEFIWGKAVSTAADETKLDESVFPGTCLWATEQILDQAFFPEE
jgi:hypothetical protein